MPLPETVVPEIWMAPVSATTVLIMNDPPEDPTTPGKENEVKMVGTGEWFYNSSKGLKKPGTTNFR